MSAFTFEPEPRPFPRWMGPFSPGRGTRSGFRFHQGRLGTWVGDEFGTTFWPLVDGRGAREIATIVRGEWGGGRILFLPNAFVVKPLQQDHEVGRRAFIGRFHGSLILEKPDGTMFDMNSPGDLRPGGSWPGPTTTGLECTVRSDGSLVCSWYHPTQSGRLEVSEPLRLPDSSIASGFRAARPGDASGRVRITGNGHVITNRQERNESWVSMYVGWIDPRSWTGWKKWMEKEHL